jgi:hypothetical protein
LIGRDQSALLEAGKVQLAFHFGRDTGLVERIGGVWNEHGAGALRTGDPGEVSDPP